MILACTTLFMKRGKQTKMGERKKLSKIWLFFDSNSQSWLLYIISLSKMSLLLQYFARKYFKRSFQLSLNEIDHIYDFFSAHEIFLHRDWKSDVKKWLFSWVFFKTVVNISSSKTGFSLWKVIKWMSNCFFLWKVASPSDLW